MEAKNKHQLQPDTLAALLLAFLPFPMAIPPRASSSGTMPGFFAISVFYLAQMEHPVHGYWQC